ncbi:MAG: SpoVA/SpoVAEb family sporulation membrane protein [Butyricicoccus sp.]|nr:SpoVA/SpoVAEb family sporulation membrane protein [Butyricicoccus sp.]
MKLTKAEYQKMLEKRAPKSPIGRDVVWAAVVGGAICVVGQAVVNFYKGQGLDADGAAAATSLTMIFLGGLFTALHLYDKLAKRAGAGTIVPITGFANAVIAPAIEFKTEGFILGTAAKMFAVAGPVIVYGVTASVIYGLVLYFFG